MPAGPVMRPGAEAWHGGPSTWALWVVAGRWVRGLPPTEQAAHSTRWGGSSGQAGAREDPDPVKHWL